MDKFSNIPFMNEVEEDAGPSSPDTEEDENLSCIMPLDKSEGPAQSAHSASESNGEDDDCKAHPDRCTNLKGVRKCLIYGGMEALVHILDLTLDIYVTVNFFKKGEIVLAILGTCFIAIPYLCTILLSLLGFWLISRNQTGTKRPWCALVVLHTLPIVPVLWYVWTAFFTLTAFLTQILIMPDMNLRLSNG
ncbi:unnamed protein product [Dibothriocephalus latus]|uniref:XK-related protein n=1 Tax=Dibothriocephalus latus TaxID=60516 RepID=A0A3P6TCZ7_DIBLA|nr:unnamed protein product [Dibothriocephalus latus]